MPAYSVVRYEAKHTPPGYINMIKSRWLRSLRYGNDYFRLIKPDAFYDAYGRYIAQSLERPEASVRLALLSDAHDVVLGFSVARGSVLDYVHVDQHSRRLGIGRSLIPDGIDTITHVTKTGLILWANKKPEWVFNPFI